MRWVGSLLGAGALAVHACGGPSASAKGPAAVSASDSHASEAGSETPAHAVSRSAVRDSIGQGLGVFLQRVDLDGKPVLAAGRFHGFRIAALRDPAFWNGVDLKPGDVVTSVNGLPIERPEQAQAVFESLQEAPELRVTYERDGERRELVYPIVDER